jgi:hypothetical protein
MPNDLTTFGGRIAAKALDLVCPYCHAKPGEKCRTVRSYGYGARRGGQSAAHSHAPRWHNAKAMLLLEGDGPDEPAQPPGGYEPRSRFSGE